MRLEYYKYRISDNRGGRFYEKPILGCLNWARVLAAAFMKFGRSDG
jgi:hypothetical protein